MNPLIACTCRARFTARWLIPPFSGQLAGDSTHPSSLDGQHRIHFYFLRTRKIFERILLLPHTKNTFCWISDKPLPLIWLQLPIDKAKILHQGIIRQLLNSSIEWYKEFQCSFNKLMAITATSMAKNVSWAITWSNFKLR